MAGRKIRDAADARACLTAAKRARSRAQWAREHGVDGRSLNAWRMNLARGTGSKPRTKAKRRAMRLVELVPSSTTTPTTSARYAIRCGALTVEVDAQFDAATLRRLLQVVVAC